jgi:hypothetical protein
MAALCTGHFPFQSLEERAVIGQAGQAVVGGLVADLFRGAALLRDIEGHADATDHPDTPRLTAHR